ncbi:Transposon Ty3-I Gag-Pol polyprotein [Vitis vinifera]|uniref:Transposon Ty3-I Gag-Pol polyprotein n=1 Tax=Vitis vinifera TaxID=29760 RepID=A0A438HFA8_VITVI|nr:Transposon Ty3-I Gag-Pol polyprotein [Vitis vinifera]
MGRDLSGLENPGRILSGFKGMATTSLGDIVLPVQEGPVTLNVQFSVVQDLSPFNAILGRTWLHYMKAIPLRTIKCSLLTPEKAKSVQDALQQSHDFFAWTHSDMKGIHPSIASHRLNVLPTARPVRQRIRRFHPDRQKIIRDEIDKLLEAGFIREVEYLDWLANVVVVPKKKGKWQVCVDYINLNNACPKDSFPLPRIDQIVDSTAGQGILSFLDAFFGYHQIPMAPADEEKTVFITLHGLYCYKVMPFQDPRGTCPPLARSLPLLKELRHEIESVQVRFGVSAGKFLGFMVSQRGIEVSPDQVKTVMETPPPRSKKELQRLTGKLVTLGRFIACFTDELRPFFLAIQKACPTQRTMRGRVVDFAS